MKHTNYTSEVVDVCPLTRLPRNSRCHILDPNGLQADEWKGATLSSYTDPYHHLLFVIGSPDDFVCFDYKTIKTPYGSGYLILHAVLNSETGHFIEDFRYSVIDIDVEYDYQAIGFVEEALDWCAENDVKHDKTGWGQDPWFFARCVHLSYLTNNPLANTPFVSKYSDREKRFGGKRINRMLGRPLKTV